MWITVKTKIIMNYKFISKKYASNSMKMGKRDAIILLKGLMIKCNLHVGCDKDMYKI